jgi:hypothetical protein
MTTKPVMSVVATKAALDAATALVNTGGTGNLYIRSGAQEATTLTADAGTLGATLPMSATAFPASTSGTSDGLITATANAITSDTNAAASITAAHFRIKNGAGTVIFQGNVGTSGADLNLNTTTITAGDTVSISSFKITLPCGDGVS